jgi:fructose-bisphosphate aldolase, class II
VSGDTGRGSRALANKILPSLGKHQTYLKEQLKCEDDKPTFFVFHGGSGSAVEEFQKAIACGVVKVNLDTDLQWAYLCGVRDYVTSNIEYLKTQIGNPEGDDKPNKKKYDPRVWVSDPCSSLPDYYR